MERSKEHDLFENRNLFFNIIDVFTDNFGKLNASLLNLKKMINPKLW